MGWFAFFEIAQARYLGMINIVRVKARKNATPARTEMYPKRLISKSWESTYSMGNFHLNFCIKELRKFILLLFQLNTTKRKEKKRHERKKI